MCGISGIYNFSGKSIPNAEQLVQEMNHSMAQRGPDDEGVWANESQGVYLGHRRLSILDTSKAGHQPMLSKDGQRAMVFNGEIYNFKELASKCDSQDWQSNTDTEVLLALTSTQPESVLSSLRGMFAFATWDVQKEQLFLARDRVGQKPLYYTEIGGIFAFSSQLKSLLQLPWIHKELDEEAVSHFLTFNHLAPPYTMFKGIRKFEPGHYMVVSKDGVQTYNRYYHFSFSHREEMSTWSQAETSAKILEQLESSVQYRMVSDAPVGAFLSGGVDSSAVVGLMKKQTSMPISTFSIGFEGQPKYDELQQAKQVSNLFKTQHHERVVTPADFIEHLPKIIAQFDEPLADTTSIPIYFLSQLASETGTKVILTGDGADELFAGYSNWKKYVKLEPYFRSFNALPTFLKKGVRNTFGLYSPSSPTYEMLNRSVLGQDFFWAGARGFKESTKHSFLSAGFNLRNSHVNSYHLIKKLKDEFQSLDDSKGLTFIDWLCFSGLKDTVPNLFLQRLDKLGMAHSIEGRTPFLDHDLISTALAISGDLKLRSGEPKHILKKSLEGLLPNDILYRKKQGFCAPIKEWANEIMVDFLSKEIEPFCKRVDIFDLHQISALIKDVASGNSANVNRLWTIYFFVQWYNKWFDE